MCLFLFKQKTAYGVRMSDWSSDVCSSDLQYDYRCSRPAEWRLNGKRNRRRRRRRRRLEVHQIDTPSRAKSGRGFRIAIRPGSEEYAEIDAQKSGRALELAWK